MYETRERGVAPRGGDIKRAAGTRREREKNEEGKGFIIKARVDACFSRDLSRLVDRTAPTDDKWRGKTPGIDDNGVFINRRTGRAGRGERIYRILTRQSLARENPKSDTANLCDIHARRSPALIAPTCDQTIACEV